MTMLCSLCIVCVCVGRFHLIRKVKGKTIRISNTYNNMCSLDNSLLSLHLAFPSKLMKGEKVKGAQ